MKRVLTKTSKMPRISGLVAGCLAGVALLVTASAASAKTYHPTRTDDPKPNGCKKRDCSLREAVIAFNALGFDKKLKAAIVLRPGERYVLTRKGAGEDDARTGDLDVQGAAASYGAPPEARGEDEEAPPRGQARGDRRQRHRPHLRRLADAGEGGAARRPRPRRPR